MLSFLASLDTCTSRAKRYADGVASTATIGHPYNLLCLPGDARWSEVADEFCAMRLEVPCELSNVVAAFLPTRLGVLREDIRTAALSEHFELGKDAITFHKKGVPYGIVCFTMNSTREKPAAMCKEGMLPDLFAMFCCDPAWASALQNLQVQVESCTSLCTARRSSTTRKACLILEFNKKGLPYGQVLVHLDRPLPRTRRPDAVMPSNVAAVPWPAKTVKPDSPPMKQTLHASMMADFMGEISRAQLEYARCAGKGRSYTKP